MKKLNYCFYLFLIFFFVSCTRQVRKETDDFSEEQVDFSKIDPLAQFSTKEDTTNLFETFSSYEEKKIERVKKNNNVSATISYYVQVGLTDSYDEIYQLKGQIVSLLPEENIEIKYDPPFYRVLIGPFNFKSKANEIFSILERKNFTSIRIRTETSK